MISATLAAALAARRSDFNARFRLAAQRYPQLEGAEVLRFIAECVDPLICAVQRCAPTAVAAVTSAAYDCALQLVGQRLTVAAGRHHSIPALWRELLPQAAVHVAESPALLVAFSNAAHHLATAPDQAAQRWQQRVLQILPACMNVEQCLLAGQVSAWLCGLAHYREGALAALRALPETLAAAIVGVPVQRLQAVLQALHADPWLDPARAAPAGMRVVRYAGAFRGFGGAFLQPPLVKTAPGGWLVRSAGEHWLLLADAFGATLHRAAAAEWDAARNVVLEQQRARLMFCGQGLEIGGAGDITSSAMSAAGGSGWDGMSAACTFAHSYRIAVVALPRSTLDAGPVSRR